MRLIVCEKYPAYVLHMRSMGAAEKPRYTGFGKPYPKALCGRELDAGWDTRQPLSKSQESWFDVRGSAAACKNCWKVYQKMLDGGLGPAIEHVVEKP